MSITERRRELDLSLGEMARRIGVTIGILSAVEHERISRDTASPELVSKIAGLFGWTNEQVLAAMATKEEVEARDAEVEKFLNAVAAAKADASQHGFKRGNGGRGSVPCPVCVGGVLSYSVASVNGHMWGKCSTQRLR